MAFGKRSGAPEKKPTEAPSPPPQAEPDVEEVLEKPDLTVVEAKRLVQYIDKQGGQVRASIILGCAPATLSRDIHRHYAPSSLLRSKLVEVGVVKA